MQVGQQVTRGQALAFLLERGAARRTLGSQQLVGADAAGWPLAPPEARLVRPIYIGWQAARAYAESRDVEFLPAEIRERHPYTLHAFVALPGSTTDFLYAGEAHLSSYGYRSHDAPAEAHISLRRRLSEEVWLALGGSGGFSVHSATTQVDGLDREEAETEVRRLVASGDAEIWIGDHSERTLTLLVNADRAFVMFCSRIATRASWPANRPPKETIRPSASALTRSTSSPASARRRTSRPSTASAHSSAMGASTAAFAGWTKTDCVPRGRHLRRAPSRGMVPATVIIVPAGETRQIMWSAVSAVGPRRPLSACLRASGQSSARRSQWTISSRQYRSWGRTCFFAEASA